jgi:hypothetical protein
MKQGKNLVLASGRFLFKKSIEWRLQVQIAFSMEVYLAPGCQE